MGDWAGAFAMHAACARGDPLSPMLFVIVMDVLNMLIAEADRRLMLSPLPKNVNQVQSVTLC